MDKTEIRFILENMGARVPPSSQLALIGGSALTLLGSDRPTIDIDFIGDDVNPSPLHRIIIQIAKELEVHVEPVPLERFIPLPERSAERAIFIGQFGNLEIHVADPYSIALSKLDRGADTDFDDIVFLVRTRHISMAELERITMDSVRHASQFAFHPNILDHLQELKSRLSNS